MELIPSLLLFVATFSICFFLVNSFWLWINEQRRKLQLKSNIALSIPVWTNLPRPFQCVDYHPTQSMETRQSSSKSQSLTVLSWNIERGLKLEELTQTMKELDPDILLLQEVDISCHRSGFVDEMTHFCNTLGTNGTFSAEFEELESPVRKPDNGGGGVHGNAILTKHSLLETFSVVHTEVVDWDGNGGIIYSEPRKGGRVAVGAIVGTPLGNILAYTLHLEPFCCCIQRQQQVEDVLLHANNLLKTSKHKIDCVVLGGDMNTMISGTGRLNRFLPLVSLDIPKTPRYCPNPVKPPKFWRQPSPNFLSIAGRFHHPFRGEDQCMAEFIEKSQKSKREVDPSLSLLSLQDPFRKGRGAEWTLTNYHGLFKGKLDFLMYSVDSAFELKRKQTQTFVSEDKMESDHLYLLIELQLKKNKKET
ncbi:hypothetical protein BLNAU_11031 [Blattamonas nauphoetae]|uniref:Endonuclease/exonuclease/phosphatase domain-containing protein n=1 Tax=Blattamonas nauphoetae TaxID=2049346 RepID=A0ABQ9XNU6_9EUKA|nr:hypothetical protein BLNAU_11031 [Blattamonas nauphoetae]